MRIGRSLVAVCALLMLGLASPAFAHESGPPSVQTLTTFGSGLGSGSTIGPDGALYVTDGNAGEVLRVDRRTGEFTTFASGLPRQVIGIGGAIDVAFVGRTAYVLVTLVGGDFLVPGGGSVTFGDDVDGIYRINRDGSWTVVADIGEWSAAHPPVPSYFITTGVQYALEKYRDGFVVTDGHHNRVLRIAHDGSISELAAFADLVPTGIDVFGREVYVSQAGPTPHDPEDSKIVAISKHGVRAVGSGTGVDGAGLAVDVERGPDGALYSLLQGVWDLPVIEENDGAPASHDSGAIVRVEDDGSFTTIVDGLDQPTSMEFVGNHAYVVTLGGEVLLIENVADGH